MARPDEGDVFALLTRVTEALDLSSRLRERDDLAKAEQALLHAKQLLKSYDTALQATPANRHDEAAAALGRLRAGLVLVDAVQYAHVRSRRENNEHFAMALALAKAQGPLYKARVDICLGAILLYEGAYAEAVTSLEEAQSSLGATFQGREATHASYHLARAYFKVGRDAEAMTLLQQIVPTIRPTSAERHIVAATLLLATKTWSVWSPQRRREARAMRRRMIGLARAYPYEEATIRLIGNYGFLLHILLPDDRRWPEV